ncbi:hypothetical protein BDW02DRAFT_373650 [Decorospora gaudefroyi]|uniref:Uncharacterized protein n=1 Tax=Decorospora gaudefroyi TaxID=184978 RepID=A0A6A5KBN3_9PLEO|nr:hypothetical protein BDW02DRAFT_373650 [Decorospora gaudefroyi]
MPMSNVELMIRRIESNYASPDTQITRGSQRTELETERPVSGPPKSIWSNTQPEHKREALRQNITRIQAMQVTGKHLNKEPKTEHKSPHISHLKQEPRQYAKITPPSLEARHPTHPSPNQHPIRIKIESTTPLAASLEIPRRQPCTPSRRSRQPPIRIPTPVAEHFYRTTRIKTENENEHAPTDTEEVAISDQDAEELAGMISQLLAPNPTTTPDSDPHEPGIKNETPSSPQTLHEIPTNSNTSKNPPASTLPPPNTQPYPSPKPHSHHRNPTPRRPSTTFSYLKPPTPTPFSTPYGPINPAPYAANIHCVSGSALEGMLRRTRWGNKGQRLEHDAAVEVARCVDKEKEEEEEEGIRVTKKIKEDGTKKRRKKPGRRTCCPWYKLPFCKCCSCVNANANNTDPTDLSQYASNASLGIRIRAPTRSAQKEHRNESVARQRIRGVDVVSGGVGKPKTKRGRERKWCWFWGGKRR